MVIVKNCVLLLKTQKSDEREDKYEVMLSQEGFTVKHLKTLDFNYINLEQLNARLREPQNFSGIIFSSPRCVQACKLALNKSELDPSWNEFANFVVGEATFEVALTELNIHCQGKESGNGNNLSDIILKGKAKYLKPFLMPCGNLRTDTIQNKLEAENIRTEALTVYESVTNPHLDEQFRNLTGNFTCTPEYIVYFSPSGVKGTIDLIRKLKEDLCSLKFIAIGPTTEAAIKAENLKVTSVAEKPIPKDLIRALLV